MNKNLRTIIYDAIELVAVCESKGIAIQHVVKVISWLEQLGDTLDDVKKIRDACKNYNIDLGSVFEIAREFKDAIDNQIDLLKPIVNSKSAENTEVVLEKDNISERNIYKKNDLGNVRKRFSDFIGT